MRLRLPSGRKSRQSHSIETGSIPAALIGLANLPMRSRSVVASISSLETVPMRARLCSRNVLLSTDIERNLSYGWRAKGLCVVVTRGGGAFLWSKQLANRRTKDVFQLAPNR